MGNRPSVGAGVLDGAIANTLAAISEHSMDWATDDDDSIWDEASLAEDVYSLGESSRNSDDEPTTVELLPSIIKISKEIEKVKIRLLKSKSKTLQKRRDMKVQHKLALSELKKAEKFFKKMAKQAPSYFGYFDYFNMVKRSYNVKKDSNLNNLNPAYYQWKNSQSSPASNKPMSTALVTQANSLYFSMFALWEAYLLKKTHIAVMQHNQEKAQKRGWNKVIMHITNEKYGIVEGFEDQEFELRGQIEGLTAELKALRNAYADLVRCQEKIIKKLQEHENWMSGSALNAFSSDEEVSLKGDGEVTIERDVEETSDGDEESDDSVSVPLEISTDEDHENDVSVTGLSIDGLSLAAEPSDDKGLEEQDFVVETQIEDHGMFSMPLDEKNQDVNVSPVRLKNEALREKLKEVKQLVSTGMRDLTLEEDEIW